MTLQNWFEKGISTAAYRETLVDHKDAFNKIYNTFDLDENDSDLAELKQRDLRLLVLAEPWCGHCMLDIPILLRIAEHTNTEVRFLLRDENLELMDQYLTNGASRTVPIVIILDKNNNEIGTWGPVAPKTKAVVDEYRHLLPSKTDPTYDTAFKSFAAKVSQTFVESNELWQGVYEDIIEKLNK